ncbi:MAG: hypothetical protein IT440_06355 [Phycisphaeraceae bacterium]|nr:hypothetical protein [Phycisphaeraceae bacterium]
MFDEFSIESRALELFDLEFRRRCAGRSQSPIQLEEWCPAVRLLPQMGQLLMECHWRPVADITLTIQRLIFEQTFVCDQGEISRRGCEQLGVDQQVKLMLRVLEDVRQLLVSNGEWSDRPATPLMCG